MGLPANAARVPLYPNSHCETCQTPLKPWQLIPIWSYLILRGRAPLVKHQSFR
ncbi:prepilin peptidase [Levilactobacillus brevis]|nr:prepilin peptidase [Levilactobacillus brevis]